MKQLQRLPRLLAAGLLLFGLSLCAFAQDPPQKEPEKNQRDRMANGTSMTGCLNKDTSGGFVLTDETTGNAINVAGAPDLEKHSANHRVTLTGVAKTDADGKTVFEVTKITHMATTCKAPGK